MSHTRIQPSIPFTPHLLHDTIRPKIFRKNQNFYVMVWSLRDSPLGQMEPAVFRPRPANNNPFCCAAHRLYIMTIVQVCMRIKGLRHGAWMRHETRCSMA